jgi:hypothetical protein
VRLLLDLVPGREGQSVSDPYYGGPEDFAETWRDVTIAAAALVAYLRGGGFPRVRGSQAGCSTQSRPRWRLASTISPAATRYSTSPIRMACRSASCP